MSSSPAPGRSSGVSVKWRYEKKSGGFSWSKNYFFELLNFFYKLHCHTFTILLTRSQSDTAKLVINSNTFCDSARFQENFEEILLPATIQKQDDSVKKSLFLTIRPKNIGKTSSRYHKSKVRKISDRFSAAELLLTPLETRDKCFSIFWS